MLCVGMGYFGNLDLDLIGPDIDSIAILAINTVAVDIHIKRLLLFTAEAFDYLSSQVYFLRRTSKPPRPTKSRLAGSGITLTFFQTGS